MLGSAQICTFIPTRDSEVARRFYVDVLGLKFVSDDRFALVLDSNGIQLRVTKVARFEPHQFTVLGWEVSDIEEVVDELSKKGVTFEKYGFLDQDERGIWTAPPVDKTISKAQVAWFKDPDGNVLSLTQFG